MRASFVVEYLAKRGRAHTEEHELEPTKPPKPPASLKRAATATDADVVIGKGPGQARSLAEAVAKVKAGGLIVVTAGEHPCGGPLETKKSFRLAGPGASSAAILIRVTHEDAGLSLTGKAHWRFEGVALLALPDPKAKTLATDVVLAMDGARVDMQGCVVAGAPVRIEGDGTCVNGVGVRAYQGAKVRVAGSLLAFNHWNASASLGGAEIELVDCTLFGAEFGLLVSRGGSARVVGGEVRRNELGLKMWGDGASIEAENVRVVDQTRTGIYAEQGKLTLSRCHIIDNGGHGVGTEAPSRLVAKGCTVRDNWCSGLWVGGEVDLTDNEIADNADHGVLFGPASRGKALRNRCHDNGRFGIVREPTARVDLTGNRLTNNDDDSLYVLGALAAALQAGFPKGVKVPEPLVKLARYQEEHGRLTGEVLYVAPGPLAGWPGLESEFAVFGTGPDGSSIAFWLHDGIDIAEAPVVYLDSEGAENRVLATTFEGFLSILATGPDDLRWDERVGPRIDDEDEHGELCEWLEQELGVVPAKKISTLHKAAAAKHPGLHERLLSTLEPKGAKRGKRA